jgi:Na+-transporting methylmalonyl-CoA/oxaloacetate decarboxylase gamma subunit
LLTNTNHENIFLMENISNLSVLFNILLNGMITVFIVLSLVFFLGKAIIYFFDSNSDDNEPDIEGEINKEIKKMEGVDAKVIRYRKLD